MILSILVKFSLQRVDRRVLVETGHIQFGSIVRTEDSQLIYSPVCLEELGSLKDVFRAT